MCLIYLIKILLTFLSILLSMFIHYGDANKLKHLCIIKLSYILFYEKLNWYQLVFSIVFKINLLSNLNVEKLSINYLQFQSINFTLS